MNGRLRQHPSDSGSQRLKPVGGAGDGAAIRPELDAALEREIRQLDRTIARVWRLLSLGGVLGGLIVRYVVGLPQGSALALLCALGFCWFSLQFHWLGGPHHRRAVLFGALFEASLPVAFLITIAEAQGPAYALGSHVPPMLFAAVMLATTARLRPRVTLVIGLWMGLTFALSYFLFLRFRLEPAALGNPLYSPAMQISRSLAFAAGGGFGFVVTSALQKAVGRAERAVREQDLFGKYRLGERLGTGGMGAVHRAVYCPEGGFERIVAVKLLHPHLAEQRRFLQGFRQEAELSAQLAHPNIVQVFDFGRVGGSYFLAMEHVHGLTLAELTRRTWGTQRKMSVDLVAWLAGELLSGLAYSHAGARDRYGRLLYVVHRDLCPANVLISTHGEVKISDFGVAKALGEASFSETKTVAGHAGYMAPEQARAEPLDARCDLFALGVVVWELLAGMSLFRRKSEGATLLALLAGEVQPVSELRAEVGPGWDAFLRRALAGHPDHRFTSAQEMQESLLALRHQSGSRKTELAELVLELIELEVDTPLDDDSSATAETRIE